MEQLVLEQFGAEPPFGGSTFLPATFLNTPFISQTGTSAPIPLPAFSAPSPALRRIGLPSVPCCCTGISSLTCAPNIPPSTTSISSGNWREIWSCNWAMSDRRDTACWLRMTSMRRIRRPVWTSSLLRTMIPPVSLLRFTGNLRTVPGRQSIHRHSARFQRHSAAQWIPPSNRQARLPRPDRL